MITIEFNDAEIEAALDNLAAALTDMSPVMNEIGMALVASTEQRFNDTQAPDGSQWAARSPVTLANYARRGESFGPVLHKSGTLRQFIDHQYGPDEVTIGSSTIYAAVQQFGAEQGAFGAAVGRTKPSEKRKTSQDYFVPIPWGNIPARPFIGVSEADRVAVLDIVGEWLERAAAGEV